jgi:hypothetical protein
VSIGITSFTVYLHDDTDGLRQPRLNNDSLLLVCNAVAIKLFDGLISGAIGTQISASGRTGKVSFD